MVDQRRIVLDGWRLTGAGRELGKVVFRHAARAASGKPFQTPPAGLRVFDSRDHLFDVDAGIPDFQNRHVAVFRHAFPIRAHAGQHGILGVASTEAILTGRQNEACGEALDIPLPRRGEGLIQIVDVENDPSFGRGISAEVEQMAVAARLHAQAGCRRARQVGRHVECRSPVKGERRPHHAPVADGNQSGDTPLV